MNVWNSYMTKCLHVWKHPRTLVVAVWKKAPHLCRHKGTFGAPGVWAVPSMMSGRRTWSHSQGMPEGCVWAGHERNCVLTKRDRCPAPRLHFLVLLFHSDKKHIAHAYCLGHLYLRATSAATIVHAQNSPKVSRGTSKHYHYFLFQGGHQSSPFCPWTELSCAPMSTTYSSFCVRFISFIKRY